MTYLAQLFGGFEQGYLLSSHMDSAIQPRTDTGGAFMDGQQTREKYLWTGNKSRRIRYQYSRAGCLCCQPTSN